MRIFLYFTFTQYQVVLQALALRIFFLVLKSLVRLPRTRDLFQRARHFLRKVCKRSLKRVGKVCRGNSRYTLSFLSEYCFSCVQTPNPPKNCVIFVGYNFKSRGSQVGLHKQKKDTVSAKGKGKSKLTAKRRTKTQGCALTAQNLASGD